MGICKECEFYEHEKNKRYGTCNSGKFIESWPLDRPDEESVLDSIVFECEDSAAYTAIYHGQDFGCIHFKAKEEEKG